MSDAMTKKQIIMAKQPSDTGHIKVIGPFPPPTGIVGPFARRTNSHIYQIFNRDGVKILGGSSGPDTSETVARAKRFAAECGLPNPTVEVVPPEVAP